MKKVFNSLFVVIAAMIAFTACVKEENAPADLTKTVQFFAESIETKSVFGTPDGTTYPTLWTENDEKVKVLLNLNEEAEGALSVSDDFKKATFNAEVKVKEVDGSVAPYKFYVMSPAAAYLGKNADRFSATIPTVQTPLDGSVDEAAQILYAISEEFDQIPESVVLNFKHFTAYGKLTLNNLELGDANILSIDLTSEVDFAGRWNYMVADGSYAVNSGAKTITLETSKDKDIWFACAPVDVSGKNMKVTVNTNKGPINREFNFNSNCSFKAGKIASFSVDMEGCAIEEPVVYDLVTDAAELTPQSKIIIVAAETNDALGTTQNSNNRGKSSVTKSGNTISDPGNGVQILTVEMGTKSGTVAFKDEINGYLYAASSTNNYLRSEISKTDNSSWNVTIADNGVAKIIAQGTYTRNWMRYNPDSNGGIFSCYGSGQKDVVIYKQRGTGIVLKNYLIVSPATVDVPATATSATFSVSSDLSWSTSPSTGATVSKDGGNVTVSFAANTTSAPKTYTVTVSAAGAESQTVTITQAAVESIATYASLTDLVGAGTPTTTARKVTVTLKDEVITGIYTTSAGYRNGVYLQVGEQEIEIYSRDVPAEWVVGGTISGTLSECDWKLYYSTWELCPSNWAELTYTAPAGGTDEPDQPDQPDQPEGTATITVNFSDYTAGVQYAKNEEHIIDEVLTLYTTLCHFTSELRIYSSSTNNGYVVSNKLPGNITGMTFNAGNKVDKLDVYGSQNGTDWTLVGQVSVTSTSYKDYSLDFAGTQYQYFKLDVNGSNQIRLKSMSVTYKTN